MDKYKSIKNQSDNCFRAFWQELFRDWRPKGGTMSAGISPCELQKLSNTIRGMSGLAWRPLLLYPRTLWVIVALRCINRRIRKMLNRCDASCVDAQCYANLLEPTRELRNQLDLFISISEKVGNLGLFLPFLRSALIDLDDVVEDCEVGSDPEIRDMLCRIADAV